MLLCTLTSMHTHVQKKDTSISTLELGIESLIKLF